MSKHKGMMLLVDQNITASGKTFTVPELKLLAQSYEGKCYQILTYEVVAEGETASRVKWS